MKLDKKKLENLPLEVQKYIENQDKKYAKLNRRFGRLEFKFQELQTEHNEALRVIEEYKENGRIVAARIFAPKKESLNKDDNTFNEAEAVVKEKKVVGRKTGIPNLNAEYLRTHVSETRIIEPDDFDKLNKSGTLIFIGQDETYKVERLPAVHKVIKIIRKKYKDELTGKVYQKLVDDPYPNSVFTPSSALEIINNKFLLGVPYYRQEQYLYDNDLIISRQTMANVQQRTTVMLEPIYELLTETLLNNEAKVIYADETTLKVIEDEKSNSYMWMFCAGFYEYPIYIYQYADSRKQEIPRTFLKNYSGYLVSDAYEGYSNIPNVTNAYCWAHARRKFFDIIKPHLDDEEYCKSSMAYKTVELIDELFEWERRFKAREYPPDKIRDERNEEKYLEILDNIKKHLESFVAPESSPLGNAKEYLLKRWEGFKVFLQDGHIELSNNISERAIKPFVIARKNFLFSNTKEGAKSSAIYFSLQQTARANGLEPVKYLAKVLELISKTKNLDDLLPWNLAENYDLT